MSYKEITPNTRNLAKQILALGVNRVRFEIPLRPMSRIFGSFGIVSCDDPETPNICYIDESRYPISDNYKILLRAFDDRFGYDSYYISDLESLIRHDEDINIKMFYTSEDDEPPAPWASIRQVPMNEIVILGKFHNGAWADYPWKWNGTDDRFPENILFKPTKAQYFLTASEDKIAEYHLIDKAFGETA